MTTGTFTEDLLGHPQHNTTLLAIDLSEARVFIMSLVLEVCLISGKTVKLQTHEDETLESLKVCAQRALGVWKGRLLNST